uniref:Transthyretin-like family-containing protein n=1 Tax=Parastrongyloides trichosuri TaxID=131310 RepID=A0A0N5A662_PARTI
MFLKTFILSFFVLISTINGAGLIGRKQAVAAKGTFKCNGSPAQNVKVELYDIDRLDMDDFIADTTSDKYGKFEISGTHKEFTTIEPILHIYHVCEVFNPKCPRKFSKVIPESYVKFGDTADKVFDLGTIDLSIPQEGEKKGC